MSVYLYAIGRAQGPVKIGISAQPHSRIIELQSGCPFELHVIHTRSCRDRARALSLEQTIHRVYSDRRIRGEWFKIDGETAIEAIDTAIEIDAHFESRRCA